MTKRFIWISAAIFLLAAGCNRGPNTKNVEIPSSQPQISKTASWSTYTDSSLGFEVKYPSDIFKLDTKAAALSHTLKNFHLTSEKDGSDLGPASDITLTFKKDAKKCQELSKLIPSLAQPYKINGLDALKYDTGAEGRGVVYYCITHESSGLGIFLIE
ncbi:MAG: hypothetical protein Q8N81_01330, partial [bacterium]|nr:hypothetical protein [bacterium]